MKTFQIIFLFLVIHYSVSGQEHTRVEENCFVDSNKNLYLYADELPKPKKGYPFLYKKLLSEIELDSIDIKNSYESMTVISFVVKTNGEICGKKVEKVAYKGIGVPDQMFKLVESLEWEPGSCQGIPVEVRYFLPFRICLK